MIHMLRASIHFHFQNHRESQKLVFYNMVTFNSSEVLTNDGF